MWVIEKRTGPNPKMLKWERLEGEFSTRDLAKNIARMRYGKANPVIRLTDTEARKTVGGK